MKTVCKIMLPLLVSITTAQACTKLMWATPEHGVFIARSEDFDFPTAPTIEIRASGQHYLSPGDAPNSARWTSKYASLMITLLADTAVEGFNEAGLSISALSLDEDSDETTTDPNAESLNNLVIVPYVLDNFSSVEAAVAGLEKLKIYRGNLSPTMKAEGHYAIQDASGDSAIIEIVNGVFKAYHSNAFNVVTNSPTYDFHLANWARNKPNSPADYTGAHPLPGNTTSEQRYIRGKYMLEALNDPTSHMNGIIKINSALPVVPIGMVGKVIDGQPMTSATQYTATYNLSEQVLFIRYQYEDVFTQYHVDFKALNDGRNYVLDATQPHLAGDVTSAFVEGSHIMAQYRADAT